MEFLGIFKKITCRISRRLGFGLEISLRGVLGVYHSFVQFQGLQRSSFLLTGFFRGSKKPNNSRGCSKRYVLNRHTALPPLPPCLIFSGMAYCIPQYDARYMKSFPDSISQINLDEKILPTTTIMNVQWLGRQCQCTLCGAN